MKKGHQYTKNAVSSGPIPFHIKRGTAPVGPTSAYLLYPLNVMAENQVEIVKYCNCQNCNMENTQK